MLEVLFGAGLGVCVGTIILCVLAVYDLIWCDIPMGPAYYHAIPIFLGSVAVGALIGLALA